MKKQIILWLIAFLFTLASVRYQRMTGPTYPLSGEVQFQGNTIAFNFERTHVGLSDHKVTMEVPDTSLTGFLIYKRYKSYDTLTSVQMGRDGKILSAVFPGQPPAGKVEYYVKLTKDMAFANIPEKPVILRFRSDVPLWILLLHIVTIFAAMMLSTRAGFEAFYKDAKLKGYIVWTFILLIVGGFILGPIVQKYSFGAFWTGFPLGTDLTDNKVLIALIGWIFALIAYVKKKRERIFTIIAAFIMLLVFLIPHSFWGSEIDFTKTETKIENKAK